MPDIAGNDDGWKMVSKMEEGDLGVASGTQKGEDGFSE